MLAWSRGRTLVQLMLLLLVLIAPARGAVAQSVADLYLFDDLFPIMSTEGITSSTAEGVTPLDPSEMGLWRATVERIYDAERMQAAFSSVLDTELQARPDVWAHAIDFAETDLGMQVLRLEISARQALLDDAVDEFARAALAEAREARAGSPLAERLALVRERIAVNNLVELNVSLGLNTTFAYYLGMLEEAAMPGMTEQEIAPLVWAQEADIRADVEDWIESYFLLAYQPLSDEELQSYIAHCASAEGDAFNKMMFTAFEQVFVDISRQVGAALGRALQAQPL